MQVSKEEDKSEIYTMGKKKSEVFIWLKHRELPAIVILCEEKHKWKKDSLSWPHM